MKQNNDANASLAASREPLGAQSKKQYSRFPAILVVILILTLAGVGFGSALMSFRGSPTVTASPAMVVGRVYYLSSEQLSENSSQGICDQVQVDLNHLPAPAPNKSYYAWLLGDKTRSDTKAILLGTLQVNGGTAHLLYPGDARHTNLLEMTSRFLVTEEDATVMPIAPSPDPGTWRYYAEFSQAPVASSSSMADMNGTNHFSYLDHLRHLLASDPMLDQVELPGGLNNWLYRNMGKVLEWTSSTREVWEEHKDIGFIRRQTVRTLTYLDGMSYVQQDLPPNTPLGINERLASIGLLEVNGPNQDPASYLNSIVFHLNGLIQSSSSSASLRKRAAEVVTALNNVQFWLKKARQDALQILKSTDQQLLEPSTLTLLNDMVDNATYAYVGQTDPATGETREGVTWIHNSIQTLVTLEVTPYSSSIQIIPDRKHSQAEG